MRFTTLFARNLIRRGLRTVLTVLGLGVGVAAVVALLGIAWGFESSFMDIYRSKGIDIVLTKAGVGTTLTSHLPAEDEDIIRKIPGVRDLAPTLFDMVSIDNTNLSSVLVNGWKPESLMFKGVHILDGRQFTKGDEGKKIVMMGKLLAGSLDKKAGDKIDITGETYEILGIYESSSLFESGGLIMPFSLLQKNMGRKDSVSGFVVGAEKSDNASIRELTHRIETALPGVAATPAQDFVQGEQQLKLVKAMAWATSFIAMVLGSMGVLNTMIMTVFERTKEIGILRALGWKRARVMNMILGESALLGLCGAVVGCLMAYISVKISAQFPMTKIFVNPNLPLTVICYGLALGVGLSLIGGFYPAVRASSLDPTEALRHE
jgi:putative ABC transport system permease protein